MALYAIQAEMPVSSFVKASMARWRQMHMADTPMLLTSSDFNYLGIRLGYPPFTKSLTLCIEPVTVVLTEVPGVQAQGPRHEQDAWVHSSVGRAYGC